MFLLQTSQLLLLYFVSHSVAATLDNSNNNIKSKQTKDILQICQRVLYMNLCNCFMDVSCICALGIAIRAHSLSSSQTINR